MRIEALPLSELGDEEFHQWRELQVGNSALGSPFFHPLFSREVAAVRSSSQVAVFRDSAGHLRGFLPFERRAAVGRPVGGRLSDYQAVIGASDIRFSCREFLKACGLQKYQFDHWLTSQPCFASCYFTTDGSPFLDLSQGYSAYEAQRLAMGGDELKQTRRKSRKAERELGGLRLVFHDDSPSAWQSLLRWKSEQYDRTGATDVFAYAWTIELLERLTSHRSRDFCGVLNSLYADDTLLAVHYGLFADGALHWWFPTYSQDFAKYSPGRIMLWMLAQQCQSLGITKIDLGRGMTSYKTRAMTDVTEVGDGTVDASAVRKLAQGCWRKAVDQLRASPLRKPARIPWQVYYRVKEWLEFR